jgi:cell division protein FtsI (penicillin-binding protein 3)
MSTPNESGRLISPKAEAMEQARNRLMVVLFLFIGGFALLGLRTVDLGLMQRVAERERTDWSTAPVLPRRADIVDRNGIVLATNLETPSLFAVPPEVRDADQAAAQLVAVLPDLSLADVLARLRSKKGFVWIKRQLTPAQVWKVNALGLPGLKFQQEERRVYPHGNAAAHLIGFVDVDGNGLAGLEHFFDGRLSDPGRVGEPLYLSLDLRIQHALHDELEKAVVMHQAIGAAGIVLNVNTGEVLAGLSLPEFDPNHAARALPEARFNKLTNGIFELGSTFKTFTIAAGLETGTVDLEDSYEAIDPIRIARFQIRDDHPKRRVLTVPEIFVYSSNIGAAKLARDIGGDRQREFLASLGLLRPAPIEVPEVGLPLFPERWREINTMTIGYGHGIAVTPLQQATALAAVINGGVLNPATLILQSGNLQTSGRRVISQTTSDQMRALMRIAVTKGTGSFADVPGYRIGGKTGTAEKSGIGGYRRDKLISSFVGVFPIEAPEYLVFAVLDEPKGTAETHNFAGGGWVAAPAVGRVIARIAPLLGISPESRSDESRFQPTSLLVGRE